MIKLDKLIKTLENKNAKRGKGGGLGIGSEARSYNFANANGDIAYKRKNHGNISAEKEQKMRKINPNFAFVSFVVLPLLESFLCNQNLIF